MEFDGTADVDALARPALFALGVIDLGSCVGMPLSGLRAGGVVRNPTPGARARSAWLNHGASIYPVERPLHSALRSVHRVAFSTTAMRPISSLMLMYAKNASPPAQVSATEITPLRDLPHGLTTIQPSA